MKKVYRKVAAMKTQKDSDYSDEIEYITGADLFLKNDANARFDEDFFLYYEETDLQLRLLKKNLSRKIVSDVRIIHLTKKEDKDFSIATFSDICNQISAIKYARKNLGTKACVLCGLVKLDWLNPYIRKTTKKVRKMYRL